MTDRPTVQDWSRRLRSLMQERRVSQRSLERQLGWGGGYLTQVLRDGPPALKVEHVLTLLEALQVEPATFFADLYGLAERPEAADAAGTRTLVEAALVDLLRRPDSAGQALRELLGDLGAARRVARDMEMLRQIATEVLQDELHRFAHSPEAPARQPGRKKTRTEPDAAPGAPGASTPRRRGPKGEP